jgi:hypothetical protein
MNWSVCPLLGEGKNLESILLISTVADLSDPVSPLQDAGRQVYNSFPESKNAVLRQVYNSFPESNNAVL